MNQTRINKMKVTYIDHMGTDDSVCLAARVSFNKHPDNYTDEQNARLISYLAKHNHWTPFAHCFITLRFKAPIAIHAQCVKHQIGFAMNTVSRRYVSDTPEYFVPKFRYKPEGNIKQGSSNTHRLVGLWQNRYIEHLKHSIKLYNEMLDGGIAPEQARFVLPQGVMTEWMWSGSLQAWARFYNQRIDPHAQKEIQDLAKMVGEIIKPLFPVTWEALTGNG